MLSEAYERVCEAHAHVGRCADPIWAHSSESNEYRLANQELWIRECRFQEQFRTSTIPGYSSLTVNDTIPDSRFARIYAVGRQYDPQREACFTPAYETEETYPANSLNLGYENMECWQLPEVEMHFRELTKRLPEQELFFSTFMDSTASEVTLEQTSKVKDTDWICQTPWRNILSQRYPPMRQVLEQTDPKQNDSVLCSLPEMSLYTPPRYTAASLQELALQMKIQSVEVREIWNDVNSNTKIQKRQRRTPRLPMEPTFGNLKRFSPSDDFLTSPNDNILLPSPSTYSYDVIGSSRVSRKNVDFEHPRFNAFNDIDARKKIFFNKNTEISNPFLIENKNKIVNMKPFTGLSKVKKMSGDKTFKILHSPQNIDSKVLNYVRNVPAQISSHEYSPSSIQGIEFNPIFTPENRPNIEEKFSRTPGAGRQFIKEPKDYPRVNPNKLSSENLNDDTEDLKFKSALEFESKVDFKDKPVNNIFMDKNIHLGGVDVPEFIPRIQPKFSSSLPNITEGLDLPEFYPKDCTNVPKKAASVYDKPLRYSKLPESTSNTIGQGGERQIPVVQQRHSGLGGGTNRVYQRKHQQGVDFNNLIFLTSDENDTQKWLSSNLLSRWNEFGNINQLINQFSSEAFTANVKSSIHNQSKIIKVQQQVISPPVLVKILPGRTPVESPTSLNLEYTSLSPRIIPTKQSSPSKVNIPKNTGAKRRLYSAVLSNTNTTMDSEYDELERQALEQYRPSEESLKGSSDDSLQAKFQELERLAMEQYTSSNESFGKPSEGVVKNDRKSGSTASMGSKKSTVILPSIGEVSNDEADSPKSSRKSQIVVKPLGRDPRWSEHSSDSEELGPQIVKTEFGFKIENDLHIVAESTFTNTAIVCINEVETKIEKLSKSKKKQGRKSRKST